MEKSSQAELKNDILAFGGNMLQCVRDKIKTADEKLRNIGKHQSATVLQTQNFTFYKSQPKRDEFATQLEPPQHEHQPQQDEQVTVAGPHENESASVAMDERLVLRHGRRERNGLRPADETERADLKRRSRSEGPNRRVRQSMDERESRKKQTFDGGGRGRNLQESSDSDESDRNLRQPPGCAGFNSDSDSDHKKWTKNPLVVRRVKRSDKTKLTDKRFSATENGVSAKHRDSWVYYGNEDASSRAESIGGGNSSSRDSGSSTKVSSKYQKLEEMRKKRINLAVTSDEENTPASRISRLRQRALQGGLVDQLKSASATHASPPSNNNSTNNINSNIDQWGDGRTQTKQRALIQQAYNSVNSDLNSHKLSESISGKSHLSQPVTGRPQYGLRVTPLSQPTALTNQTYVQVTQNVNPSFTTAVSSPKLNIQPVITKTTAPLQEFNRGLNQKLSGVQSKVSITQQSQSQKPAPARPAPITVVGPRQPFYTIPEPNSTQTNRALNNSPPEAAHRRFTTHVRIPSADPIVNSPPKPGPVSSNTNQPVTFSNNLRQIQARGSPTPNHELFQNANATRPSSQFNDVVEVRLKTTRDGRIEPQHKIPKKFVSKPSSLAYSDDTLDELVESNIQYLDSELDKAKPKKMSSTSVSRSSSLPDPRRISSHAASTPGMNEEQANQVQANNSVQFRVSLPNEPRHSGSSFGTPLIQIAHSSVIDYQSDFGFDNHLRSQPDVVPRKFSYDGISRLSRPTSEYFDRDDMSKSDSQLNAQVVIPGYVGNSLHPDQAYARGCVSDINLRSDTGSGLQVPQMDAGMFSDVEYDIQVSERVKKWETFMKVHDGQVNTENKNANLSTIQENNESDALMLPSEVRKSVLLSKSGCFGSAYLKDIPQTQATRIRPFGSDTSLQKSSEINTFMVPSVDTSANRFIQIVPDAQVGPRLGVQAQSVTSLYHTPISLRTDKNFITANEVRQQMLANRQPALSISSGPMAATFVPAQFHDSQHHLQKDTKSITRPTNMADIRDGNKRISRYHEELNEISNVKADSVINLRRRFGADSGAATSEDDHWSVSTASAKLSRPSKNSPSHSEADSLDLSNVLPGYEHKIKDTDVWSPNLETTQGVPVSMERVTARTLQTIPFSEDPFWKEIEEMTSFDPSSMAGHLSVSKAPEIVTEPVKSQHQVELCSPHSSTLPNQPRNNTMPMKDRMQRSKSLYTPNITPLSISVPDGASSSAVSALDSVLEDISRSSIERKQLSPKKKVLEPACTTNLVSGVSNFPSYLKMKQDLPQPGFKFEGGQFTFMKTSSDSQPLKPVVSSNLSQDHSEKVTGQSKQPLQFYQQQRKQSQEQGQNRQSQLLLGGVSSYHLDPNLLKQKLLNTGLVVETDTEEPVGFKQTRSSSLGTSVPNFVAHSTTISSLASMAPQSAKSVRSVELIQPLSSYTSNKSANPAAPWAVKHPGPSALHDIQKALAPFESMPYQPDPESLYGVSKLQSFHDQNFDTSRGPHVTTTSWTYQPQTKDNEMSISSKLSSSNSLSRLQQVNASMDDLKDLAQNVERKINAIKGKLQTADETSLDSILASLRKLTPEVRSQDAGGINFDEYYSAKKSKLSDALTELNRIYDDLELNNGGLSGLPGRGKYKPYKSSKSSDFSLAPQPKSEHLRPMQTRISSMFIPGLQRNLKSDLDKETESEFDILSKSFQAIVDEVNQTTDMFSKATENNRPDNMAPETQNQASKIALKSECIVSMKGLMTSCTEDGSTSSKAPPATAPKPPEVKSKGGRFRLKLQGSFEDDESSASRNRSKSVPSLDSDTKDLLEATIEGAGTGSDVTQATVIPTLTDSAVRAVGASSPASRQRVRVRPVRDNRIIQDDKAGKKPGGDKGSGIALSPHPSPSGSRKMIYNSGFDSDGKSQTSDTFQESPEDEATETRPQQIQENQQVNISEDKFQHKSEDSGTNPAIVASPASQKRAPPPTALKPIARSETTVPVSVCSAEVTSSVKISSTNPQDRLPIVIQLSSKKSVQTESNPTDSGQNCSASTVSINLTPVVESNQSKSSPGGSKQDDPDNTCSGGQRTKRRLGTGVALMLDKFNTSQDKGDKMKKRLGTRSAPDLTESLDDLDNVDEGSETEHSRTQAPELKTRAKQSDDKKVSSASGVKSPAQRNVDKRIPVLAADGNKQSLSKSTIVSSMERKIIDPDIKSPSSGTSTPQPSPPNNKPPQHPWKRQMSDPDKQIVSDAITESSIGSPKFVSKIPRLVATSRSVQASVTCDEPSLSKEIESPQPKVESPTVETRRVRPPDRKIQTDILRSRPHSFHELISCLERDPNRIQGDHKFRKYASADSVNTETFVNNVFRSEVMSTTGTLPQGTSDNRGVVSKLEIKMKG